MLIKNSEQHNTDTCDQCGGKSDRTFNQRYAYVVRGATGRHCEVMWICDACGCDEVAIDVGEARSMINSEDGSFADF